jgi:hypothetical protein
MQAKFLIPAATLLSVLLTVVPSASGQLTFTTNLYSVGANPFAVAVADVNGDGKPDLISANAGVGSLTVLTNNGDGIFGSNATLNVGTVPVFVAAADINGDGKPDLISANDSSASGGSLTVLTNNGKGLFVLSATLTAAIAGPYCVAVADVNGDGKPDLICADSGDNLLTIFLGNGTGGFTPNSTIGVGNLPEYVVAADLNSDGEPDLVAANFNDGTLSILTNNGTGSFTASMSTNIVVGTGVDSVQAVDVNGDGKLDLVCATSQGITVLTNNGHASFALYATINLASAATSVAVTNFSGTGKMDIACAENNNSVQIFTNNGSGGFGLNTTVSFTIPQKSLMTADVNGDGKPDLITANYTSPMLTVLTQGVPAGPLLKIIRPTINSLVISWISSATNFVLQTNNNLASTNWFPLNLPVAVSSGTNQSTALEPPPPGKLFFRLQN